MGSQSWTQLCEHTQSSFIIQVDLPTIVNTLGEADIVKNQTPSAVTASCLDNGGKEKQVQVTGLLEGTLSP